MANRNTELAGDDWNYGENLVVVDLNDTFDEIATWVDAGI